METLFLIAGILGFGVGSLSQAWVAGMQYWIIDEINARSPADQQIDLFHYSWSKVLRRHRELYPDSPRSRQVIVATIAGFLMMFAGGSLIFDWNSLSNLNRNRAVAPRQQAITVTLGAGKPAGHNTYGYRYTFSLSGNSYEGWEYSAPESPTRIGQQITVYYDPLNPSVNSPERFQYSVSQGTERAWDYVVGLALTLFLPTAIFVSIAIAREKPASGSDPTKGLPPRPGESAVR
jgi:hypothetical protein